LDQKVTKDRQAVWSKKIRLGGKNGGEPVWRGEPPATGAEILLSGEMLISGLSRSDKDKKHPLQQEHFDVRW